MKSSELRNLTLKARIAYAIMCFERYTAFVYSGTDFRPAAEIMWNMIDGNALMHESVCKYLDIIPESLFACDTFEAYLAAGHTRITREEYRVLKRTLNPHDWNLKTMMRLIHQIAQLASDAVQPGVPESLPMLEAITDMLTARSIALPDPSLLGRYACAAEERSFDWCGGDVNPAPLSMFAFTDGEPAPAEAPVTRAMPAPETASEDEPETVHSSGPVVTVLTSGNGDEPNPLLSSAAGFDGYDRDFAFAKDGMIDLDSFFEEKPVNLVAEENGCKWEIAEEEDGCTIIKCINIKFLKEVTIPAALNGMTVVAIEDKAFTDDPASGVKAIEILHMPDTIRRIGDWFFRSCPNLRRINMPAELEHLGHEAFRGASRLESMAIGDKCRVIGDYFCADALLLRDVTFGESMEYLGEYSFYNTPRMTSFRCASLLKELGYGSFWVNKWADGICFNPLTEMFRFCKDNALLYRYVKRNPPPRLFFDAGIKYVYDFAFGGDAWHSGDGIRDIFFPGAEKIGVKAFRKTPNATVHLSARLMEAAYGPDYAYTLETICEPAKVVFDQP